MRLDLEHQPGQADVADDTRYAVTDAEDMLRAHPTPPTRVSQADALGDRMKAYEGIEAQRRLLPGLPAIARLDGRHFHRFTKGMARPFDPGMIAMMRDVTRKLVAESNALLGYTQSDEITLVMCAVNPTAEMYFGGRVQKMTSSLAALASVLFNDRVRAVFPDKAAQFPTFDCRVWNVPSLDEAANCVLWREWDATKNSISMAASAHFSHGRLHGLNGKDKQELLFREKGINWNDYSPAEKRGTYIRRVVTAEPFTTAERDALPPKHAARVNPDLVVERSRIEQVVLPPLRSIANRVAVLFQGAEPCLFTSAPTS